MIKVENPIEWYFDVAHLLKEMRARALDGLLSAAQRKTIASCLEKDHEALCKNWPRKLKCEHLENLSRHIHFAQRVDFQDMLHKDIPGIEETVEQHFHYKMKSCTSDSFEALLHPEIQKHAYEQFKNGQLRDAVFNAVVAVFDLIRQRTGSKKDGAELIGDVLSLSNPRLVLSDLSSRSGEDDQKGFLQIYQGAYQGIRNPKAHSLQHDLDNHKAAQYLVFASLLARRISEATVLKTTQHT